MSYKQIVIAISAGMESMYGLANTNNEGIAADIVGQADRMPDYLRLPMRLATFAFDWSGLLSSGKRFQSAPLEAQRRHMESWKKSRIGACRNFIRFYESLYLLIALQEKRI